MDAILYMGCDIPNGNAAAIRVFSNALALKEYGYKMYILSFGHKNNEQFKESIIEGITVFHVAYPKSSKEYFKYLFEKDVYMRAITRIEEYGDRVKKMIVYDQPGISFLRVRKMCKRRGISYICDCAEWHTAIHLKGISRFVKEFDIGLSMRYAYKKSDGMIAISTFLKKYYESSTKVIVVPPLQNVKVPITTVRDDKISFIYAGAGVAGKDKDCIDIILHAFTNVRYKNYCIRLFGLTEAECISIWPETEKYISTIRNNAEIIFEGRVPHDLILEATQQSDYTLLIRESTRKNNAGFPTKFGESIECGTPVIATRFSDVDYYLEKYGLGLVVEDVSQLSIVLEDAINRSISSINELKKKCYDSRLFSYNTYVKLLGDFVRTV